MLSILLRNLLVTTGLAVLLAVLCRTSMLRTRPALRHWLWLLLLAKLLVPPLVGVPLLPAVANNANTTAMASPMVAADEPRELTLVHDEQVPRVNTATPSHQATPDTVDGPALKPFDRARTIVLGGLLAVSLAGTCVLSVRHGSHAVELVRWLRRAGTEESRLTASCAEVALRLKIRGGVRCCVIDARTTPMLLGWCRPLVVVPRQLLDDLSPEHLQNILAHELAHLVRRDHWANGFVFVVKLLFWWNPVVWWADRELHAAQELCCDWIAIDCCDAGRRSYATTLLKALDFIQAESLPLPAQALGMGSRETLLRRFEMIGETDLSYRLSRGMRLVLLLLATLSVCVPVRARAETPAGPAPPKTELTLENQGGCTATSAGPGAPEEVYGVRPQGNCSLSGTLVSASTGKPIARARMYLFYNATFAAIFVNTDSDGAFVFRDIPKGPYSLCSSHKAGYRDATYDPESKSGQFPPFTLDEGEQRSGIVLKAEEACRVAGEIRDENGNVPSDTQAMLVYAWFTDDGSDTYSLEQGFVKADGSYVIDGLGNRPVYVMATNWRTQEQGEGYPAIFAPSTFFRGEARLVTFDQSRNVDGVNITLRKPGGLVLEGTVRDEKGEPIPEALVVVHHRDMLFDRVTTYSDAQGHYELQGLGDGEVLVHVDAMQRGFVRTRAPIALEAKTPKVRHDFILHRGASISGKLVDPDGKPWQIGRSHGNAVITEDSTIPEGKFSSSWSGLTNKYGAPGVEGSSTVFYIPGEGDYDRSEMVFPTRSTFVFPSLKPGYTRLSFSTQSEGQKVLQILHNGQDILQSGLTTQPGDKIEDITIVVGTEPATDAAESPATDIRPVGQKR